MWLTVRVIANNRPSKYRTFGCLNCWLDGRLTGWEKGDEMDNWLPTWLFRGMLGWFMCSLIRFWLSSYDCAYNESIGNEAQMQQQVREWIKKARCIRIVTLGEYILSRNVRNQSPTPVVSGVTLLQWYTGATQDNMMKQRGKTNSSFCKSPMIQPWNQSVTGYIIFLWFLTIRQNI